MGGVQRHDEHSRYPAYGALVWVHMIYTVDEMKNIVYNTYTRSKDAVLCLHMNKVSASAIDRREFVFS